MNDRGDRNIIVIDEEKCDGCGVCVPSCAEGAIAVVGGKARLVRDSYCDGLGACIADCPQGALTVERRDAEPFDAAAVALHLAEEATRKDRDDPAGPFFPSCPGSKPRAWVDEFPRPAAEKAVLPSELRQWPVQLHLVPPDAPWLDGADLLLVADCVPVTLSSFHRDYLRGKRIVIACPKLDGRQERYIEKLAAMMDGSGVRSLTVMIMEVPCCSGLFRIAEAAAEKATTAVRPALEVVGIDGAVAVHGREIPGASAGQ